MVKEDPGAGVAPTSTTVPRVIAAAVMTLTLLASMAVVADAATPVARSAPETSFASSAQTIPTYAPRTTGPDTGPPSATLTNDPHLPAAVQRIIRRRSGWVAAVGCSSWLLQHRGVTVGAIIAEHCLRDRDGWLARPLGSDGHYYVAIRKPLLVKTGNRIGHLHVATQLDRLLAYRDLNLQGAEVTLGIAKGHSTAEVLAEFEREIVPYSEITKLKVGQKAYGGAYSDYGAPQRKRITWSGRVMGLSDVSTNLSPSVAGVWLSVTSPRGQIEPIGGTAGAGFITKMDGRYKLLGIAFGYHQLLTSPPSPVNPTAPLRPTLGPDTITAEIAVAYDLPIKGYRTVLRVVRSEDQIPGFVTLKKAETLARARLATGNAKTIVQGTARLDDGQLINRMVLMPDYKHAIIAEAWADPSAPDGMVVHTFPYKNFNLYVVGVTGGLRANVLGGYWGPIHDDPATQSLLGDDGSSYGILTSQFPTDGDDWTVYIRASTLSPPGDLDTAPSQYCCPGAL